MGIGRKKLKKFQKSIDKSKNLWYNKYVIKRGYTKIKKRGK